MPASICHLLISYLSHPLLSLAALSLAQVHFFILTLFSCADTALPSNMKLSGLLLPLSLLSQSVLAVPFQSVHDAEPALVERQSTNYTAVIGVASANVYPRLEIRQMYWNRPNQFLLLLLALQQWQAMPQSDKLSYYQIAGIHGVPRQDWDGVSQCDSCGGTDGYCPHDSVLFPAWHRVYMALFEQQFMSIVNQVVNTFPSNRIAAMQGAASTMRFPFWDWAAAPKPGYPTFPTIVSMKYFNINGPTGQQTIVNPLFRFGFQDTSDLYYYPFTQWKFTFRYPTDDSATASSTEPSVIAAFDNIRTSLQDQVYQLFSTCTDYLHFSNDDAGSSSTSCSNSLEAIHNTVHTTSGGPGNSSVAGGHMTYLPTAAFDPVFWLHHNNVDRLFAMWQAINPGSYGGSQTAPHSTWTIPQGSVQDQNSPLTPMHKDAAGNFYTTDDVEDWTQFKYTYPEFADSDGSAASINSYINKLYGPSATATAGSSKRTAAPEPVADSPVTIPTDLPLASVAVSSVIPQSTGFPLANATGSLLNNTASVASNLTSPTQANNGSLFQYVANIKSPRYMLNGSYVVYLFNGPAASDVPSTWITDPSLIGPYGVLATLGPGMNNMTLMAAGSIPLTRSLTNSVADGIIPDLSEEVVVPYLQTYLNWRIAGPDGDEVMPDDLPGFDIKVYSSTASIPSDPATLPKFSDFIPLEDVTKGTVNTETS